MSFGVVTNKDFKAYKDGSAVENLYAAGAVLGGFNALKEGSGAGVSILTALYVSSLILDTHEEYGDECKKYSSRNCWQCECLLQNHTDKNN